MSEKMPDLLFAPEHLTADSTAEVDLAIQAHLAACPACREQLAELRSTMALLDTWQAPEPNPYFLTRLNARLDEERAAAPASWPARVVAGLRARFEYGSRLTLRPVAAMAMTVILLAGGGAYLGINFEHSANPPQAQTAVVHDLQTLDTNAQLLDQLESLSDQADDQGQGQNTD
jgi:anti-sigma factor RsiW